VFGVHVFEDGTCDRGAVERMWRCFAAAIDAGEYGK